MVAARGTGVTMIYPLTICLSAFLLFLIQPLISKMLLPQFGGGASIWITSLVFFQVSLLIGYAFTHFSVRRLGIRRHMYIMAALLAVSLVSLPVEVSSPVTMESSPTLKMFLVLAASIGIPYLVLATTSPTLQYWIANDNRTQHASPYIQYGVSNVGSMAGLLVYPFILERYLTNSTQSWLWTALYLAYAALMVMTIVLFVKHNRFHVPGARMAGLDLTHNLRVRWIFLAMVPAALLVVITHYLTLDLANLPLLWVVPLSLYLLTFIICFLFPAVSVPRDVRTLLAVASILFLLIVTNGAFEFGFGLKLFAALTCLFCVCMIFHGDLERGKPHKQDLTDFYLQLAAGGSLGSIVAAVIAPLVFDSTFEFYVVIVAALYYIVASRYPLREPVRWLLRGGIAVSITISWVVQETGFGGETIYQARSFYSTYAVRTTGDPHEIRRLVAGTHVHGEQYVEGPREHEPIAYYHAGTGIYDLFDRDPSRVAVVGLGIGTVVEFGDSEDTFDLFELDPLVIDIANRFFSVLPESTSQLNYHVGDARLRVRDMPAEIYDLVVMDTFTSGSIPIHLVTLEAVDEIVANTKPDGVIAYHISNQHVDLLPVLNAIADELDIGILYHESQANRARHEFPAIWVALVPDPEIYREIAARDERWRVPPDHKILWRDGFSNLWSVVR